MGSSISNDIGLYWSSPQNRKTKMAKLWLECDSLCVIFLLFSWFSASLSDQDYYFYEPDYQTLDFHTSQDSLHSIQIRSANDTELTDNSSNIQLPANINNIVNTSIKNSTSNETINNRKPLSPPLEETLSKNLDENGTGIRKHFTTVRPVVLPSEALPTKSSMKNQITFVSNDSTSNHSGSDKNELVPILFPSDSYNKTFLQKHNITKSKTDTHIYYNSTITVDENVARRLWVDFSNRSDVKLNDVLSQSHRRASTVKLSFDFPFYGHPVRNITIATGGFLYTGDYVHSWLAATQYIAPLMANFDTSLFNDSCIKYVDNGTSFTVQWEKVSLQDKPEDGQFTFQTTLLDTGDIIFVYKDVPLVIENIKDDQHPVKVGLSDAYIIDRTIFLVRRKTIYEYHRVNFNKEDIKNWTVIYLVALSTCLDNKDCLSCINGTKTTFKCSWCPIVRRCSNGYDRHRQDWVTKGCDERQISNESRCHDSDIYEEVPYESDVSVMHASSRWLDNSRGMDADSAVKISISGIMTIIFLIAFVGGLGIWVLYAYRNPHTTSGQMLIRYRPSQWRWKRGEARYTAATIHM